jgi:hypothetical protein
MGITFTNYIVLEMEFITLLLLVMLRLFPLSSRVAFWLKALLLIASMLETYLMLRQTAAQAAQAGLMEWWGSGLVLALMCFETLLLYNYTQEWTPVGRRWRRHHDSWPLLVTVCLATVAVLLTSSMLGPPLFK